MEEKKKRTTAKDRKMADQVKRANKATKAIEANKEIKVNNDLIKMQFYTEFNEQQTDTITAAIESVGGKIARRPTPTEHEHNGKQGKATRETLDAAVKRFADGIQRNKVFTAGYTFQYFLEPMQVKTVVSLYEVYRKAKEANESGKGYTGAEIEREGVICLNIDTLCKMSNVSRVSPKIWRERYLKDLHELTDTYIITYEPELDRIVAAKPINIVKFTDDSLTFDISRTLQLVRNFSHFATDGILSARFPIEIRTLTYLAQQRMNANARGILEMSRATFENRCLGADDGNRNRARKVKVLTATMDEHGQDVGLAGYTMDDKHVKLQYVNNYGHPVYAFRYILPRFADAPNSEKFELFFILFDTDAERRKKTTLAEYAEIIDVDDDSFYVVIDNYEDFQQRPKEWRDLLEECERLDL